MIILPAVIVGLIAGLARAIIRKRRYQAPILRFWWLVFAAYVPQLFAFFLPMTRSRFPEEWVPAVLIGSQVLLVIFAAANIRKPGFWALGLGLALNFLVIALNGGFMPVSPETIHRLAPDLPADRWPPGVRLGTTKDMVMQQGDTKLWILSDWLAIPSLMANAFSIGDVLIAIGTFWLLWSLGGPGNESQEQTS